jgi:thiol-disulfide isomerase/thioredoxin
MMKNNLYLLLLLVVILFTQCDSSNSSTSVITDENTNSIQYSIDEEKGETDPAVEKTVTIKGNIANGGGLKIYFDRMTLDASVESLENTTIEGNGNFKITLSDIKPSPYRMRIGQKMMLLFLEGKEVTVEVKANLSTMDNLDYTVANSANTTAFIKIFKELKDKASKGGEKEFVENIANFVDTTSHPLVGLYLTASNLDTRRYQYPSLPMEVLLAIHQRANTKYKAAYSDSDLLAEHNQIISQIRMQVKQQSVKVGVVPPDITMQSPDGKTYSLSQLKGKVVLLDFWASWCGPCRRTNPELVRIYNKFKDQNFTVFSVSLDRNAQSWRQAIFKDNLTWEYHVSDLQYWNSTAAKLYNVTSIPRTFLINKDGTVAAMNLMPGAQLEQAIQKLL